MVCDVGFGTAVPPCAVVHLFSLFSRGVLCYVIRALIVLEIHQYSNMKLPSSPAGCSAERSCSPDSSQNQRRTRRDEETHSLASYLLRDITEEDFNFRPKRNRQPERLCPVTAAVLKAVKPGQTLMEALMEYYKENPHARYSHSPPPERKPNTNVEHTTMAQRRNLPETKNYFDGDDELSTSVSLSDYEDEIDRNSDSECSKPQLIATPQSNGLLKGCCSTSNEKLRFTRKILTKKAQSKGESLSSQENNLGNLTHNNANETQNLRKDVKVYYGTSNNSCNSKAEGCDGLVKKFIMQCSSANVQSGFGSVSLAQIDNSPLKESSAKGVGGLRYTRKYNIIKPSQRNNTESGHGNLDTGECRRNDAEDSNMNPSSTGTPLAQSSNKSALDVSGPSETSVGLPDSSRDPRRYEKVEDKEKLRFTRKHLTMNAQAKCESSSPQESNLQSVLYSNADETQYHRKDLAVCDATFSNSCNSKALSKTNNSLSKGNSSKGIEGLRYTRKYIIKPSRGDDTENRQSIRNDEEDNTASSTTNYFQGIVRRSPLSLRPSRSIVIPPFYISLPSPMWLM